MGCFKCGFRRTGLAGMGNDGHLLLYGRGYHVPNDDEYGKVKKGC